MQGLRARTWLGIGCLIWLLSASDGLAQAKKYSPKKKTAT